MRKYLFKITAQECKSLVLRPVDVRHSTSHLKLPHNRMDGQTDGRTDGRTDGEIKTKLFKGGPNTIGHHGKSVFKRLLASSTGSRLHADIARFCFGTERHIVHITLICILNDPVIQRS